MSTFAESLGNAFGFLYAGEIVLFKKLAASLPPKATFVNIGAGAGTSSLSMVEARPDLRAFTVDISEGGPFGGLENERNAFANTGLPLPVQMLGDSKQVGRDWAGGLIDMIFIDGDHSYEGCSGDIEAWHNHVKPGGIIAIHDYEKDVWPAVKKATDEAAQAYGWQLIEKADTLIAFKV